MQKNILSKSETESKDLNYRKAELNISSHLAKLNFGEVTKDMLETFISEDFEIDKKQIKEEKRIGFLS